VIPTQADLKIAAAFLAQLPLLIAHQVEHTPALAELIAELRSGPSRTDDVEERRSPCVACGARLRPPHLPVVVAGICTVCGVDQAAFQKAARDARKAAADSGAGAGYRICPDCGGMGHGEDRIDGDGDVYQGKCPTCDGAGRVKNSEVGHISADRSSGHDPVMEPTRDSSAALSPARGAPSATDSVAVTALHRETAEKWLLAYGHPRLGVDGLAHMLAELNHYREQRQAEAWRQPQRERALFVHDPGCLNIANPECHTSGCTTMLRPAEPKTRIDGLEAALRALYLATLPAGTIRASEIERIAEKHNVYDALGAEPKGSEAPR
jgi:hypothetical protein